MREKRGTNTVYASRGIQTLISPSIMTSIGPHRGEVISIVHRGLLPMRSESLIWELFK
jgi:hypothetical protein